MLLSVEVEILEDLVFEGFVRALELASLAFCAASVPA